MKIETKKDGNEFACFDELLSQIVGVPKDEILNRKKAEKQKKEARKVRRS